MQFGVSVPNIHRPGGREAIREVALAADALGYDAVWMGDHVAVSARGGEWGGDMFGGDLYEVFTTAGYVAALTQRVRIGFGVIVLPLRNPVVTAKMIATLDNLSLGRIIVGVGVGGPGREFDTLGIDAANRGARADEYLAAFRALWSADEPVFRGRYVHVEGVNFKPRPIQRPLPIWIGGLSPATYRRAVRLGDGWIWHGDAAHLRPEIARLKQAAEENDRDFTTLAIANQPPVRFAERPTPAPDDYYPAAARTKPNPPLIGPPNYIAQLMHEFEEMGVTHTILDLHIHEWYYDDPLSAVLQAMETFAVRVRPQLAKPQAQS